MTRRHRKKRLPEPVADIAVESLAHDGRCVAHVNGKVVFIDGALPGERVAFEYLWTRRKFDEGRVTAINVPSPYRVAPQCPHFGICGGCSLQHMEPGAQIRAKQDVLLDNFQHIGGVAPDELLPPLIGPAWGYRTKARLGVRYVGGKGRVLVGFREKYSSFVTELTRCEVLAPTVGRRIHLLAELIDRLEARTRIPQVEVAVSGAVTALVFRHLDPLGAGDLELLRRFALDQDLHIWLQPGGPDTAYPLWPPHSSLSYRLPQQGITIQFLPTDFTQINTTINAQMVARVLELLALVPADRVLDLFCGLGNFTLPMARLAGKVTGVEGEAGLVERARDNARRNAVGNAAFYCAELGAAGPNGDWAGGAYDKVLLDPPRSGAADIMPVLGRIRPGRVVYVSCHPGSLARDAGVLVNRQGYRLVAAGVMDMFPHTAHVESIALFELP